MYLVSDFIAQPKMVYKPFHAAQGTQQNMLCSSLTQGTIEPSVNKGFYTQHSKRLNLKTFTVIVHIDLYDC